jgi:ATP-dependent DNA helicase RecG
MSMMQLDTPVQYIKGVGPRKAEILRKVGVETLEDCLYYFPRDYLDRSAIVKIEEVREGGTATVLGEVVRASVRRSASRRSDFVARLADDTGSIECIWFNQPFLDRALRREMKVVVSGDIVRYRSLQFRNPSFEILSSEEQELIHTGRIVPRYPLTAELSHKFMRGLSKRVLDAALQLVDETLPESLLDRRDLLPVREALQQMHFPDSWELQRRARARFAFEELFYLQVMLAVRRKTMGRAGLGVAFDTDNRLVREFLGSLPFELTSAQEKAIRGILGQMKTDSPMNCLLEGEVGSGKTVVALAACLAAIGSGRQAAFMAPTEILAEQHMKTIKKLLGRTPVKTALLIGRVKGEERRTILAKLKSGAVQLGVGTHALIQEGVEFDKLGLIVVDEQHRFGVMQRAALKEKGGRPDVLVMTATPIPRTLAMTAYGDLDIVHIDEIPSGRQPVITRATDEANREKVYEFAAERLREGKQAYVVYPLVEESEKLDLKAATERAKLLAKHPLLKDFTIGLLHGKMKGEEKDRVMDRFRRGDIDLLVTTTVIEVGVDVAKACIMIVEHPERYGLSQLHQLRGRVGRGPYKSYCVVIKGPEVTREAEKRISVFEKTVDGRAIADADLKIRGPGEFFGTRQHGLPELRVADIVGDALLLSEARGEAFALVDADPNLAGPENRAVRATLTRRYSDRLKLASVG